MQKKLKYREKRTKQRRRPRVRAIHSMCCIPVLDGNAWWSQGELICKADLTMLWCSVHREGKRAAQNGSKHLSAKIRTNEIQYTWLEGKERIVTDRRHEWKLPVAALHHDYQCISQATDLF